MLWAGPAEVMESTCEEQAREGAGEEQAPEGARVAQNWTEPAGNKVSWTGPAEASVSWTEPAEALVSWTEPAEASVSWTGFRLCTGRSPHTVPNTSWDHLTASISGYPHPTRL